MKFFYLLFSCVFMIFLGNQALSQFQSNRERLSSFKSLVQTYSNIAEDNFTIADLPEQKLINPLDDSIHLKSPDNLSLNQPLNVNLVWYLYKNSTNGYEVQVNTVDNDWGYSLIDEISLDTVYALKNLKENTTYYWRISLMGGIDNIRSEIRSFKTMINKPTLTKPSLLGPFKGDSLFKDKIQPFAWNSVDKNIKYELQIFDSIGFTETLPEFGDHMQIDISNLDYGKKYYWNIRTILISDTTVKSEWSDIWYFYTQKKLVPNGVIENNELFAGKQLIGYFNILGQKIVNIENYSGLYIEVFRIKDKYFTNKLIR
jgi:hypothetical protein